MCVASALSREMLDEKFNNHNLYKVTVILLVSTVLYISTVAYENVQENALLERPLVTNFVSSEKSFINYTFYGEEKPKLECWSDHKCTNSLIKQDILKRLPESMRDQVEPTLVKTGE